MDAVASALGRRQNAVVDGRQQIGGIQAAGVGHVDDMEADVTRRHERDHLAREIGDRQIADVAVESLRRGEEGDFLGREAAGPAGTAGATGTARAAFGRLVRLKCRRRKDRKEVADTAVAAGCYGNGKGYEQARENTHGYLPHDSWTPILVSPVRYALFRSCGPARAR